MSQSFEIKLPRDNVNDQYVMILNTLFADGDFVKKDDIIIEYETSKADVELASEFEGYIKYYCKTGDEIQPGNLVVRLYSEKSLTASEADEATEKRDHAKTVFSKAAQKIISEYKLNIEEFDEYDFVTKNTVLKKINAPAVPEIVNRNEIKTEVAVPENPDNYDIVKISPEKKREINNLSDVQKHSLISPVFVKINLVNVLEFIRTNPSKINNSILPIIVFEVSRMLKHYREMNAFFNNDSICYYKKINIGIAVDIGKGLKVVTVYDADKKSFKEIDESIWDLYNKYLDDKLSSKDMDNSTFTISDLSGEGASLFIPLINYHQSAILGLAKYNSRKESVFVLTFDHRIMNGKLVANFLNELKERIESYYIEESKTNAEIICSKCMITLEEEKAINGLGLVKIINSEGKDSLICLNCLRGW